MYRYEMVSSAISSYDSAIDSPASAIDKGSGSCLAFAGNLGAQALVRTEEEPLIVRVSTKKHSNGLVSSHFMAVDPREKEVCDMLASGPRKMSLADLRKPYGDYQLARDRLLKVAIATHLIGEEDPFVGEDIVEDGFSGIKSTIRVVRIELGGLLKVTSPGTTAESLVTKLEAAVV